MMAPKLNNATQKTIKEMGNYVAVVLVSLRKETGP